MIRIKQQIPIFIGYDYRERAATNVLIDSIYQNSSRPVSITPLVTEQLRKLNIFWRKKDPKQSTDFSFTRFLVPYLMNFEGHAIFLDCDFLSFSDIADLWDQKDPKFVVQCVKHNYITTQKKKFLGEPQNAYPKKNWSSLMIFNCENCKALTPEYVNSASGLDLHRFKWLKGDHLIGSLDSKWNYLVGETNLENEILEEDSLKLVHWTLGGPWFKDQRTMGGSLAAKWFSAREGAMKLWD